MQNPASLDRAYGRTSEGQIQMNIAMVDLRIRFCGKYDISFLEHQNLTNCEGQWLPNAIIK